MSSFKNLKEIYEKTKRELKDTENNIRRITGRDPDEILNSSGRPKYRSSSERSAAFSGRKRPYTAKKYEENESINEYETEEDESDESPSKKPALMSTVVAKRQGISRRATIEELNANKNVKARNKRMFGAILGTLEKFKREEKEREEKESMRIEIERKVEEKNKEEIERIKKEKETLITSRREKKIELRCLEKKLERAEPFEVFEANHRILENFIITRSKPPIFFLPASHTPVTKKRLSVSRSKIQELIEEHKKSYDGDIMEIDEWYKKDSVPSEKENECPKEEGSQDVPEPDCEAVVAEPEEVITIPDDEEVSSTSQNVGSLADQDFEPIYD